jgi:hypothetical protein
MEAAVITSHQMSYTSRRDKSPLHLFSRDEAKNMLGDYAFSLIDKARNSDTALDEALDRLDAEGINTEDFEDAALGRLMEEGLTGEYISEEEFLKFLRQ